MWQKHLPIKIQTSVHNMGLYQISVYADWKTISRLVPKSYTIRTVLSDIES